MAKSNFPCSYLLLIRFDKNTWVEVGALGEILLQKGWYVYVGRARKGIYQRLRRHLRREKKHFWHIDYLLKVGKIKGIAVFKGEIECELGQCLYKTGIGSVLRVGLGSSDCRCKTHFFKIKDEFALSWPSVADVLRRIGLQVEDIANCFLETGSLEEFEIKALASFERCVPHNL